MEANITDHSAVAVLKPVHYLEIHGVQRGSPHLNQDLGLLHNGGNLDSVQRHGLDTAVMGLDI